MDIEDLENIKKGLLIYQGEAIEDNSISIVAYVEPEAVTLSSEECKEELDEKTIADWFDFVGNTEVGIEQSDCKLISTTYVHHDKCLPVIIEFYKILSDKKKEKRKVRMRIEICTSDIKNADKYRLSAVAINNEFVNNYEEALNHIRKVLGEEGL